MRCQAHDGGQLGRGEDLLPAALRQQQVPGKLLVDGRHRLQGEDHGPRQSPAQVADLGHGRAGTLPFHHHRLLSHGDGLRSHVRHIGREVIPSRPGLVSSAVSVQHVCTCVYASLATRGRVAFWKLSPRFERLWGRGPLVGPRDGPKSRCVGVVVGRTGCARYLCRLRVKTWTAGLPSEEDS